MTFNTIVIQAKALNVLRSKLIGYNHDNCKLLYFGKTNTIPEYYKNFLKKEIKGDYCAIIREKFK